MQSYHVMKRFHPSLRPETLSNKALATLDERRFKPQSGRGVVLRMARTLGMDDLTRVALERLLGLAETRKIGVVGCFMPDDGVSARLAGRGIEENVEEEDFFRCRRVVTSYGGIALRQWREWKERGYVVEDFSAPQVRRAQVALGLMRMEGAQGLVIGRHDDSESLALAGSVSGARILQDTTDTARLEFSPMFGAVCQTTLSPRRVAWLVQQLRFRYRDSRVTFVDTVAPAMAQRVEALEKLLPTCDRVVIVGRAGEASCEALAETALHRGKPALVVATPDDLETDDFKGNPQVALTAGAFALDETIRIVAEARARI